MTGANQTGGLVGSNNTAHGATVSDSFWDIESSGRADQFDGRGIGKTSDEMTDADTFSAWNISAVGGSSAVWRIYEGYTGPLLRSCMTSLTVAVDDVNTTYNGANQALGFNYDAGSADTSLIFRGNVTARNAGSYSLGDHLYSDQQGYDISYTGGALNIARPNLTLSTSDVVKTYDGTTNANGTAVVAPCSRSKALASGCRPACSELSKSSANLLDYVALACTSCGASRDAHCGAFWLAGRCARSADRRRSCQNSPITGRALDGSMAILAWRHVGRGAGSSAPAENDVFLSPRVATAASITRMV